MDGVAQRMAGVDFGTLRAHQADALTVFRQNRGLSRFHFVLPPGAGKTLLGSVIAQEVGRRVLVLVPNTAIAAQWLELWESVGGVTVGDDRGLSADVTVLTYQALATFDDDADDDDSPMARLHPNARALVDRLHGGDPFTLVLDEAHHLAATWGELLAQVLEQAHGGRPDGPVVVALTATPRGSLSQSEATLVNELFGSVLYSISTPALVRDSVLAPYRELPWFVDPTDAEREYLTQSALRWQELIGAVMAPGFADVALLAYLDSAWVRHAGVSWNHILKSRPELARALVRAAHNGLIALPDGARIRDEHRQPLQVEDWVAILADYGRTVLVSSDPPAPGWDRLRAGLRSVGWTLTRNGARRGQSSVDKVLARSAAKAVAAAYLVSQEYAIRGEDLRVIVLTDFENAQATPPADIASVLSQVAGSAWEALAQVHAANPELRTVLVTGASVGGTRESLAEVHMPGQTLIDRPDGLVQIQGTWSPRDWVPHVTDMFTDGRIDVLIGTRGLLGEGWNAPAANVMIDLTATTTPAGVVQIRGRAIRRDPIRPQKVAHVWSVTTVDDEHPRGDLDYRRLVAKHRGYLAPDAVGRIVAGVEHLDPRCGRFAPPDGPTRAGINADALTAATLIDETRAAWRVGSGYRDVTHTVVRVRRPRTSNVSLGVPEPAVRTWPGWPVGSAAVGAGAVGSAALAVQAPSPLMAAAVAGGAGLGWLVHQVVGRQRIRRIAQQVGADGMLLAFGRTVAEAMHPGAAPEVAVDPDADGEWVLRVDGMGESDSRLFGESVEQILRPIDFPRYIISRRVSGGKAVMWHGVPDVFGVNKQAAESFASQWRVFVSRGDLLYTGAANGGAVADTVRGLDPMDLSTAMYAEWG